MQKLNDAADSLKKGGFAVIYDGDEREGEADIVLSAKNITPGRIELLRKDAGGLICLAIGSSIASKLGLDFMTDILENSSYSKITCKKTAYGDKPAFSIPINHKDVYTGITDNDRSLTISEFAKLCESENSKKEFENNFYSPGHVFLLIGRGIENRKGHTELALALAERAGMSGCMVLCEMLGKGKALSKKQSKEYAERNNIPFIEGCDLYE
ncbi:3,4-dihydroxy-2-butanone-4-phosphate synthase [Candidatus Micrarchaeota archaeon]|nr:3,4-dihydroxy-2-butanone-4-phosphate synthase [Candidatus Micrarchaeota archaeon]